MLSMAASPYRRCESCHEKLPLLRAADFLNIFAAPGRPSLLSSTEAEAVVMSEQLSSDKGLPLGITATVLCCLGLAGSQVAMAQTPPGLTAAVGSAADLTVRYRTIMVSGIKIFYREAGSSDRPTILLLHGFSSSSHMFRDLLPLLAGHFHLVAPDYPGFGYSDAPPAGRFEPTFGNLEQLMENFTASLGLDSFVIYMQDFGGPVGFRLAVKHPEKVLGLIIQNANAYLEGLPSQPKAQSASADERPPPTSSRVVSAQFIKYMYVNGARNVAALNPDAWTVDIAALQDPEAKRIQSALIDGYQDNIARYSQWQAYLRTHQPKTLIVWGRNDAGFLPQGAEAYRRDLRTVELRFFDTGHFALEEDASGIAQAITESFARR
jgi:pimeloyl-ACP methyl ester carboxylesterase